MQNKPKNLIIHHSASLNSGNADQFKAIDNYHRSKGYGGCGYHYVIIPSGRIYGARAEDKVGAHCYQKGMNALSIGICLTGNFDVEKPTDKQIFALRDLMKGLTKKYSISKNNIWFHRDFAPKTCPGRNVDRGFVRNLVASK
jgi:N-acetyl-anhydromuramyl-L-alanine amidase AmpD